MHSIALFAPIEGSGKDINSRYQGVSRDYEREAIKCFKCWRRNGGWLSNIPIYAICPTRNTVSKETQDVFSELNVHYIEHYLAETDNYSCGYWSIPLVGTWAEENISEEVLIKIDLDMYLIHSLPENLFEKKKMPLIGRYDDLSSKHPLNRLHIPGKYGEPFDTGLIITERSLRFYQEFYNELAILDVDYHKGVFFKENKYGIIIEKGGLDYGFLEEFAISVLNLKKDKKFDYIKKYNIGEFYADLDSFSDEEVKSIYFIHEHVYDDKPMDYLLRLKYKKRKMKLGFSAEEILLDNCD